MHGTRKNLHVSMSSCPRTQIISPASSYSKRPNGVSAYIRLKWEALSAIIKDRFRMCRSDRSFHFNLQPAIRMLALRNWLGIHRRGEARPRSPLRFCWRRQPLLGLTHLLAGSDFRCAVRTTDRRPWTRSVRRCWLPRLLMPSNARLSPLECCRGTRPIQAARGRPFLKSPWSASLRARR